MVLTMKWGHKSAENLKVELSCFVLFFFFFCIFVKIRKDVRYETSSIVIYDIF